MAFLVRDCIRCGVKHVQQNIVAESELGANNYEIVVRCQACRRFSAYEGSSVNSPLGSYGDSKIGDGRGTTFSSNAIRTDVREPIVAQSVPARVGSLFKEASVCRMLGRYEAAGAMFRKTVDIATKHLFSMDERLKDRKPADALRSRIRALGELGILDADVVELADVAALDGNDATHDVDPYTADEAEALEDLTSDLIDRLFVRPAKLAAVRAKQVAAGQRKT